MIIAFSVLMMFLQNFERILAKRRPDIVITYKSKELYGYVIQIEGAVILNGALQLHT